MNNLTVTQFLAYLKEIGADEDRQKVEDIAFSYCAVEGAKIKSIQLTTKGLKLVLMDFLDAAIDVSANQLTDQLNFLGYDVQMSDLEVHLDRLCREVSSLHHRRFKGRDYYFTTKTI